MDEHIPPKGKETIDEIIGRNIEKERNARNMTREDLAAIMNMTKAHIGLIEKGKRGVVAQNLYNFGRVFGVPLEFFFENSTEANFEESFILRNKELCESRKKFLSLITNFTKEEMDFALECLRAFNKMKSDSAKKARKINNKDDDEDYYDDDFEDY